MRTILVTGGAAFSAAICATGLIARGDDVICLDNFFTGRKQNIAAPDCRDPRFELIRHDIVHPVFLKSTRSTTWPARPRPWHYQYNPIKTIKTSTVGMVNMLGLAKRCRARLLAGVDLRSLRRSRSPSADRGVLGARQPDRAAQLLRRRQARRRVAVHELPPSRTGSKSASSASSTPTGRGWTRTTGA